ncbi:uncharacterized protein LOC135373086 [Ornithodoros turicata]|uniref:uncharacterized protein LOC135373086 n=1 Tax=Ornithodoros turicata TaxID=34597 RepID=UPI003139A9B2
MSSWKTIDSSTNSDHLLILFVVPCSATRNSSSRILNNRRLQSQKLDALLAQCDSLSSVDWASHTLSSVAQSLQQSSFCVTKRTTSPCAPWWNDDCARAYRRRKAAWKQVLANTCYVNWKNYQFCKALFKRSVATAKREFYSGRNTFLSAPNRRKALHRHIALLRSSSPAVSTGLTVLSDTDFKARLEEIAKGLSLRFFDAMPLGSALPSSCVGYHGVSADELEFVVQSLPGTAPGPDGISAATVKSLWANHRPALLNLVNTSLQYAWIPATWKVARIVIVKKAPSNGLTLDNIRPIALTSVLCKTVERIINRRLLSHVVSRGILAAHQIGFRPHCSIWLAHTNIESQIRLAKEMRHLSALVALDIAKAYDSVIHAVLLQRLLDTATPPYLLTWIANFLSGRTFFCSDGRFVSSAYPQSKGVPQGSVLSPILFTILMSSLPCDPEVLTVTYADDIAFFASAPSLPELYAKLQAYMNTLSTWLDSVHLSLNVAKSAILVFPLDAAISIDLRVGLQSVRQVSQLKYHEYLGVWYDEALCWSQHIDYLSAKASKALCILHRCCSPRIGMRRAALLYIYKLYIRPVLEFGCVLFSSLPDWRLSKLYILERRALRLCLGLPKYTANDALLSEARLPSLKERFRSLTICCYLSQRQHPIALENNESMRDTRLWLTRHWHRRNTPQLPFAEQLLAPLRISLADVCVLGPHRDAAFIQVSEIFHADAKRLPLTTLQRTLTDHLNRYAQYLIAATGASVSAERAGAGLYFPQLDFQFPVRLPDFTPPFESEFLAMALALRRVPPAFEQVILLSDSLSVISALASPSGFRAPSESLVSILARLAPPHIRNVIITWIPGHCGLTLNETADTLAKTSLSGEILPPPSTCSHFCCQV